jgi:hypothetical protein
MYLILWLLYPGANLNVLPRHAITRLQLQYCKHSWSVSHDAATMETRTGLVIYMSTYCTTNYTRFLCQYFAKARSTIQMSTRGCGANFPDFDLHVTRVAVKHIYSARMVLISYYFFVVIWHSYIVRAPHIRNTIFRKIQMPSGTECARTM